MLAETGIYVFESKNYSGWIFGNEKYKQWTQTMLNGQKFKFFNPVWQNNAHINTIKKYSGLTDADLFKSYIIFSERCTLKDITIHSPRIKVMKRNRLHSIIKQDIMESEKVLSLQEVLTLFNQLNKLTLADDYFALTSPSISNPSPPIHESSPPLLSARICTSRQSIRTSSPLTSLFYV